MNPTLQSFLRCPVDRSPLELQVLETGVREWDDGPEEVVQTGILFSGNGFFYPIIGGIPRMLVEAFDDFEDFLRSHLPDYDLRVEKLEESYGALLRHVRTKNGPTKKSFTQEWEVYQYEGDKTWNLEADRLLERFFHETDEQTESLLGKWVLDAGCGHGQLNIEMARQGISVIGMDFSRSVDRAYTQNPFRNALFVQADVEFPPFDFQVFDLIHSSGVLIHTQRTELSFSCLEPCLKSGGKLSLWCYHPRKDFIHRAINRIRNYSSRLPVRVQNGLFTVTLLPLSFLIKRLKGNPQSLREMKVEILDWFSPRYRWEHEESEVYTWFRKRNFHHIRTTDRNLWGFNQIGIKGGLGGR